MIKRIVNKIFNKSLTQPTVTLQKCNALFLGATLDKGLERKTLNKVAWWQGYDSVALGRPCPDRFIYLGADSAKSEDAAYQIGARIAHRLHF